MDAQQPAAFAASLEDEGRKFIDLDRDGFLPGIDDLMLDEHIDMDVAGADDVLGNLEVPTPPMDTSAAAAADLPHETCGAMRKMSLASADTAEAAFKRTFIAMHANHNGVITGNNAAAGQAVQEPATPAAVTVRGNRSSTPHRSRRPRRAARSRRPACWDSGSALDDEASCDKGDSAWTPADSEATDYEPTAEEASSDSDVEFKAAPSRRGGKRKTARKTAGGGVRKRKAAAADKPKKKKKVTREDFRLEPHQKTAGMKRAAVSIWAWMQGKGRMVEDKIRCRPGGRNDKDQGKAVRMMFGDGFLERYNKGGRHEPFEWMAITSSDYPGQTPKDVYV